MDRNEMMSRFKSGKTSIVCGIEYAFDFLDVCKEYGLRWAGGRPLDYIPFSCSEDSYEDPEDLCFVYWSGGVMWGSLDSQYHGVDECILFWEVIDTESDVGVDIQTGDLVELLQGKEG